MTVPVTKQSPDYRHNRPLTRNDITCPHHGLEGNSTNKTITSSEAETPRPSVLVKKRAPFLHKERHRETVKRGFVQNKENKIPERVKLRMRKKYIKTVRHKNKIKEISRKKINYILCDCATEDNLLPT